jgi:hypothetical protein
MFYVLLFIIYALGALVIHLFAEASLQQFQKDKWKRDLKNPIKCFLWGLTSPITLFLAFCDWAFIMEHTGYVDGREARDEVTRRKVEQMDAQNKINGYKDV